MRWCDLTGLTLATLLALAVPQLASAMNQNEADCYKVMLKFAGRSIDKGTKYLQKHRKIVEKCTSKMDDKPDHKCDDGFDRLLDPNGDFDWAIDKFQKKFLAKMKKKCRKLLNPTDDNIDLQPSINKGACKGRPKLGLQMECELELAALGADSLVCDNDGFTDKNANRGALTPPDLASFCTDPNTP